MVDHARVDRMRVVLVSILEDGRDLGPTISEPVLNDLPMADHSLQSLLSVLGMTILSTHRRLY